MIEYETMITENADKQGFPVKKWRKASNVCSLMLIIFIIIQFWAAIFPRFVLPNFIDKEKDAQLFKDIATLSQFTLQYFVGVPLAIFLCRLTKTGKESNKTLKLLKKPEQSVWWVIRWIIITIGFTYLANIATTVIVNIIQSLTGIELNQVTIDTDDTLLSKLTSIFAIIILAPIFEELLMRDAYLGVLKRFGTWSAAIATGVFFGLLHANYPQIPFAAVMGTFSAFMVIKTKSIIPSLIVHFSINTIGGTLSIFMADIDIDMLTSGNTDYITEHVLFFFMMVCVGILIMGLIGTALVLFILEIVLHRESFMLEPVCPEVSERKKFALFFTAPLTIVLTIALLTITVLNAIP